MGFGVFFAWGVGEVVLVVVFDGVVGGDIGGVGVGCVLGLGGFCLWRCWLGGGVVSFLYGFWGVV